MRLDNLGFDRWFRERVDADAHPDARVARIIAVNKDNWIVDNGTFETPAEMTGRLIFRSDSPLDYPAVGDWVYAQYFDDGGFAVIHGIFPRKSLLKRKSPGKKIAFQLIAANIDTALIVQALDADYNLRRMERYLAMVHGGNIHPVVLLSKQDLLSPGEVAEKVAAIRTAMPDIRIVAFSNENRSGLDRIAALLASGRTFCMLGSSGVGKTSLLNHLAQGTWLSTQPVREKSGKGRHTTTRRQLIRLANGAMIIDTPGMRELGNFDVDAGIDHTFDEIAALSAQCRYADCTHDQEQGCAVLAALNDHRISGERYANFIKMRKESAHYAQSYVEKKRKDKQFGKLIRSVMKHKKSRG